MVILLILVLLLLILAICIWFLVGYIYSNQLLIYMSVVMLKITIFYILFLNISFYILVQNISFYYYCKNIGVLSIFSNPKQNFLLKIQAKISNIVKKAYNIVFNWLDPNITIRLVFFARDFLTYKQYYLHIIYILEIIPRVIILTIFILEIFMGHLHYYFYSLTLLILPLVLRGLIHVLKDIGPRVLPEIRSYLYIKSSIDDTVIIDGKEKNVKIVDIWLKPEYRNTFNLDYILDYYFFPLQEITIVMENDFVPKYNIRKYIIRIIYHGIHVIGWIYILKVFLGL